MKKNVPKGVVTLTLSALIAEVLGDQVRDPVSPLPRPPRNEAKPSTRAA